MLFYFSFRPIHVGLQASRGIVTWPPEEKTTPTIVPLAEMEEESIPMTTVTTETQVGVDSTDVNEIIQSLTCGDINTTFEINVYKYVIPSLIAEKEAESVKSKDKMAASAIEKEEQERGGVGELLEKIPNVEQAKTNQPIEEI